MRVVSAPLLSRKAIGGEIAKLRSFRAEKPVDLPASEPLTFAAMTKNLIIVVGMRVGKAV